jgi:hypothetical protein
MTQVSDWDLLILVGFLDHAQLRQAVTEHDVCPHTMRKLVQDQYDAFSGGDALYFIDWLDLYINDPKEASLFWNDSVSRNKEMTFLEWGFDDDYTLEDWRSETADELAKVKA